MKDILLILKRPPVRDRLVLIAIGLFLFLPFLGSVHLFDWDEANFAEAAREMIVTGNYFRVQIDFEPFWEKPPFFFWLQALSMHLFGTNEFSARFPNALCGIVTLLIVYSIGTRLYSMQLGFLWALAFLGSILPHIFFKSGVIDPVFNLLIFSGIFFLTRATAHDKQSGMKNIVFAGLLIGIAVLAKGPVGFLVPMLCIAAFWASARFRPLVSIARLAVFAGCAAAVSLLFYGIETLAHGTWFMREFIAYHLRLLATSEAGHAEPFYYHFFVLLIGCFPASILAIRPLFYKKQSGESADDFKKWMACLFWVVLILFSIVKTKTVLYSSLAYFPITFFAAWHVDRLIKKSLAVRKRLVAALCGTGVCIGLIFAALPVVLMNGDKLVARFAMDQFSAATLAKKAGWTGYEYIAGIAFAAVVCSALVIISRGKTKHGFYTLFAGSMLCIELLMIALMGPVEEHMQRAPVDFYKSLAGKDVYVKPLFKTFAHLFYTKKAPPDNALSRDRDWLCAGPIDKPAYFIARNYQTEEFMRQCRDAELLYEDGGFVFFRRAPPRPAAQ